MTDYMTNLLLFISMGGVPVVVSNDAYLSILETRWI